ncbi:MAG: ATP-binding cassette domain-containing protein [Gammaproteobacteria bacterium]|nr:ATP-binding cassette domain-containing protein [Gammaproteobacteria bacterium]MDP7268047.1 ATP-binding cassette domain-containing protein [Pirellulales bacterium]HJN66940.1 ATP-binding cassette domain-containing protein [Pirellulales bacterium]
MTALVRSRGLICRLGNQLVLNGTDFDVADHESIALLGSSGSGKSTLLRVIAGLETARQGELAIDGKVASHDGRILIPPHRRGIAMMFQDLALWPNLTVAENVRLGLSGLRLSRDQSQARIEHALDLCDISELADRRPGTLSGGQQQRLALARALAMRPKLLMLDEPLGGLDLITKQAVLQQIAELKAELGFAVILVTHDPVEVYSLCNSLAVLENGRIVEQAALDEIVANPQSALAKAFVRAMQCGE